MASTFRSSDILQQMDFAMIGTHFASGPFQMDQADFNGTSGVLHDSQQQQQYSHDDGGGEVTPGSNGMPASWQSIAAPGSTVADYLSHLPATLTLHHFLKYSGNGETAAREKDDAAKKPKKRKKTAAKRTEADSDNNAPSRSAVPQTKTLPPKIRVTNCNDGTTMYGCPECPAEFLDKYLLGEHITSHPIPVEVERRYVCDICNARLKRKDHLTRHRLSHSSERPFACTVCSKAFKRKEQLNLHQVVHTGEKRHACIECGRAFYRKDHLRKHAKSHAARRDKSGQTC